VFLGDPLSPGCRGAPHFSLTAGSSRREPTVTKWRGEQGFASGLGRVSDERVVLGRSTRKTMSRSVRVSRRKTGRCSASGTAASIRRTVPVVEAPDAEMTWGRGRPRPRRAAADKGNTAPSEGEADKRRSREPRFSSGPRAGQVLQTTSQEVSRRGIPPFVGLAKATARRTGP